MKSIVRALVFLVVNAVSLAARKKLERWCLLSLLTAAWFLSAAEFRRPRNDSEVRYWLQNMVWYH